MPVVTDARPSPTDQQGSPLELAKLLRIAWRRKWLFILPLAAILAATFVLINVLPKKYSSTATIFVEGQNIPENLVPSLTTDYVDRRLDILTRKVLLTTSLTELIKRYDLYPALRESVVMSVLVERMRQDIKVVLLSTEVSDVSSGRSGATTVAFQVSFIYPDPDLAQRVTNELVSFFLATNLEVRRDAAEQTTSFLATEREAAEARIAQIEDEFAVFQTENRLLLPEEAAFSRQLLANVDQQLSLLDRDLRALKEREGFLTTQLALTDEFEPSGGAGGGAVTPESQLELLRAELATARARYSSSHPDVVRLQREVRSLESVVGTRSGGSSALATEEAALLAELGALRQRYTADHPDVVRLERQLASVRSAIASAGPAAGGGLVRNSAFVELNAQLNSVQTERRTVEQQRTELEAQRLELQERLARAPAVEREYTRLSRELENAIADRDIIADKEATATLGRALETEAVGERLSLAEPPTVPLSPVSPNKPVLLAIGLLLGVGVGGATVFLFEMLDRSIRSADDLAQIIGEKPLVMIPTIGATHRRALGMRAAALAVLGTAAAGGTLLWVDRAVVPLDVMGFEFQNRVDSWWATTFATGGERDS